MLSIRLSRIGKKKQPNYRIIVLDKQKDPWGDYLENLGFYNPMAKPKKIELKEERIKYWLSVGAQPSPTVHNLLVDAKIIDKPKVKATIPKKKTAEEKPAEAPKPVEGQEKPAEEPSVETPVEAPAESSEPIEEVKEAPIETPTEAPAEEMPAKEAPVEEAPAEEMPAEEAPAEIPEPTKETEEPKEEKIEETQAE